MASTRVQKILTLTSLCFIGFFLIIGSFPISNFTVNNNSKSSPSLPSTAFGETPFDSQGLITDPGFDTGLGWTFGSSQDVNASWNSTVDKGYFNHTSQPQGSLQPDLITQAIYRGSDETAKIQYNDSTSLKVSEPIVGHYVLDVYFPQFFKDGDIITMQFRSGNPCTIYVRDPDTESAPLYGTGSFSGNVAEALNITLSGITNTSQNAFNLEIDFALKTQNAFLDQVMCWRWETLRSFSEDAYINQSVTIATNYDVAYSLQCTGSVTAFQNIQTANFSVQINESIIWSQNLGGVAPDTRFSIQLPHNLLQKGGTFALVFHLILTVYTAAAIDFRLFIDDVYLNRTPNTNLLDDSACITGTPWTVTPFGTNYAGGFNATNQYLQCYGINVVNIGGANVSQSFSTNSSQTNYTLVFNYYVAYMTGIDHMNISISYNGTLVGGLTQITKTSSSWAEFRLNSTVLTGHRDYVLNITLSVKPQGVTPSLWGVALDNIYLYPNWNRNLTQLGTYPSSLPAGQILNLNYQYNATGLPNTPIRDANVTVYNNDTGVVWGLDTFGTSKFQVYNFGNGTYNIQISTIGFSVGKYNISVVFYRANFPDTGSFIQFDITGGSLNATFSAGATFNDTYQIFFVDADHLPYVDDTTKKLTILVTDPSTGTPITDAFVEANLAGNVLAWAEIYKSTGNPSDKGLYNITLDTTGLNPYTEYLQLNFSVRVTATNYSAQTIMATTIVKPLPASIAVPDIAPFYEGSTLDIVAIFQDTFHGTGIDYANITWEVVSTAFTGQLDFVFLGFYESELPLSGLASGNYTLHLTGQMINYETCYLDQPIEVLPKWNVSIVVAYPSNYVEGNSYDVTFNCTYTELGGPLVGESINFFINYTNTGKVENYNLFTGDNGLVTITLVVPMNETLVNITATYGGKTNVSTSMNNREMVVLPRAAVSLTILTTGLSANLVGETNLEIRAKLTYANGTPIVNATLTFRISTSEASVLTDATGVAVALIKLPTEGSFPIIVTYEGTSMIQAETQQSNENITVISPTTAFMNQMLQYVIYAAIIFGIVFGFYMAVSRGVVRPRQRTRQAEYVGLMNRFEDARNVQLLMLINRESGTEIYSKALSGVPVDPTLVTGFLQAITSFGKEILAEDKVESLQGPKSYLAKAKGKAETRILEFHHFKIVLEETVHLRVALLLLKNPSQRLLNALHKFSERSETRFGDRVDQLRGRQLTDDDTWEIIDDAFEPSLIYVHMMDLVHGRAITPTKWEKVVMDEIQRAPFNGEAYLDTLQEQIAHKYIGRELEIVDAGLSLRHKNVLLALSPRYMEVRLTIKKAIDALPVSAKHVILTIGDGESNPAKIVQKVKIPQNEYQSIVQQLQELGIITEKLQLDMAGKLVYTTLKVGAEKLKK